MGNEKETFLGIDIGGTCIKWGVVDGGGSLLDTGSLETQVSEGVEPFLLSLCALIGNTRGISGVGVCTAGIVDSGRGKVLGGIENIPFLKGLELRDILQKAAHKRVEVLNDVSAAALGESWVGAGRGCANLFCVTVGTGIGGSLMLDGRLFEGAHFHAGEIGYLHYAPDGSCLESGHSARALMKRAAEAFGQAAVTPDELFDRVAAGEPKALAVYREWLSGLGAALADVLLILDPEKLIIGGGVTERGELLRAPLAREIQKRLPPEMGEHCSIELAQCGNHAGILGAVRYYMTHMDVDG